MKYVAKYFSDLEMKNKKMYRNYWLFSVCFLSVYYGKKNEEEVEKKNCKKIINLLQTTIKLSKYNKNCVLLIHKNFEIQTNRKAHKIGGHGGHGDTEKIVQFNK